MRYFKDFEALKRRLKKGICWDDYISVNGKTFKMYEYGGGSMFNMNYDYIYLYNKKTKTMIFIKYNIPCYEWKNGEKIQTQSYKFIDIEIIKEPFLWREDTL